MRRSEIIRRVTDAMRGASFTDDRCVQIAESLGVTVEPDEPELPALLWPARDGDGGPWALYDAADFSAPVVRILGAGRHDPGRVAEELVRRYNDHGRPALAWQTGEPRYYGLYVVRYGPGRAPRLSFWNADRLWCDEEARACYGTGLEWIGPLPV